MAADSADREAPSGGRPMLARQRAKEDAAKGGPPANAGYFPLSYRDGFSQWWAGVSPAETEHRVLSFIPYLQKPPTHTQTGTNPSGPEGGDTGVDRDRRKEAAPVRTDDTSDPYGPRQWQSQLVQLAGKNKFLNEFSVERVGEEDKSRNSLVMLHGYGAGLGFFYKNFEALSRLPNWKLYALDLLGMGRSSRPSFKIHSKEKEGKIREAENWFIDALEEWRIKRGIDKMTLLGHSLGGYLAVCYALKYPGHLNKLILASPVGVPEDPYAVSENTPDPDDGAVTNEFTQSAADTTSDSESNNKTSESARKLGKPPPRRLPRWAVALWDANISPFSFVRLSGPLGPRLISGWTSRRFSHLPEQEAQALHDYSYSLFRQRGSGEYALGYILAPGAFARSPLIHRIQGVGRQFLDQNHSDPIPDSSSPTAQHSPQALSRLRETGIPVVFMYGSNDWMDVNGGRDCEAILTSEKERALQNASQRERELENGSVKVQIVRNAGHHLYLEGHEEFNQMMLDELKDVEKRQAKLAGKQ